MKRTVCLGSILVSLILLGIGCVRDSIRTQCPTSQIPAENLKTQRLVNQSEIAKNLNLDSDKDGLVDVKELENGCNPYGSGKLLPSMTIEVYLISMRSKPIVDYKSGYKMAEGELLIGAQSGKSRTELDYLFSKYDDLKLFSVLEDEGQVLIGVKTSQNLHEMIEQLKREPVVKFVEPNYMAELESGGFGESGEFGKLE